MSSDSDSDGMNDSDVDSDESKENDGRNAFYILVDDRERKVIPHMDEIGDNIKDIPFFVERLTVGDYAIMYRGTLLAAVERKSWKDMAASIKDGRKRNVCKLLEIRDTTQCTLVYLIEGKAFPNTKSKVGGIRYKNLQAHLDHLMFRDNISYVQTANTKHTAIRLFEMTTNLKSMGVAIDIDKKMGGIDCMAKNGEQDTAKLKKKHTKTDDVHRYEIWEAIPWITSKTASLLIDDGVSVHQFLLGNVDIDTLAGLRYPSGVLVGKIRAKKMLMVTLDGAKSHESVLRAVPNVGKTIAQAILKVRGLLNWLKMERGAAKDELEELKRGNRRIVNDRSVKNLIKFLWSAE
jgi:ERCC4-type nuclease